MKRLPPSRQNHFFAVVCRIKEEVGFAARSRESGIDSCHLKVLQRECHHPVYGLDF
jgi:hypothetical protein